MITISKDLSAKIRELGKRNGYSTLESINFARHILDRGTAIYCDSLGISGSQFTSRVEEFVGLGYDVDCAKETALEMGLDSALRSTKD